MKFEKVHACGNDFICLLETIKPEVASGLCDRYHGVGADGIMAFLGKRTDGTLEFAHWDPDGSQSFCLNGTRAWLSTLIQLGKIDPSGTVALFGKTLDYHMREYLEVSCQLPEKKEVSIRVGATEIAGYSVNFGDHFILNPEQISADYFRQIASQLRWHTYFPHGANIHWLQKSSKSFKIISFERGVEGFTKACGSGILSAAAAHLHDGCRSIRFEPEGEGWVEVLKDASVLTLYGPTEWIYRGELCSSFGFG